MDIPTDVAALGEKAGPFATAYLDASRSDEQAAGEIALRWRALREQLAEAGADEADLDAMGSAAEAKDGVPGRHGRLLVASGGRVVLDRVLADPPDPDQARMSALPHLMPFLVQLTPTLPHLIVVADHTGADLTLVDAEESVAEQEQVTGSAQHPVHRTDRADWGEQHFQNKVEQSWKTNADDITAEVVALLRRHPVPLVVLAGNPQERGLLREELPAALPPGVEVAEIEHGSRGAGSSDEALAGAVREVVLRQVWRQRHEILGKLRQGTARHDYGVLGLDNVLEALRKAQVDTLVLSDDPSSTTVAYVGPEPLQIALTEDELRSLGVEEIRSDRLDAALVRALAGSNAQIVITPGAHDYLPDGIGATLRYADALSE